MIELIFGHGASPCVFHSCYITVALLPKVVDYISLTVNDSQNIVEVHQKEWKCQNRDSNKC